MIISDTAIKNKISVIVLAMIILVFGVYSYIVLPRESSPDIPIPFVFVSTSYKGVSSSDIETSITIPIEKKLKGLDGVKKIKSVSSEGQSFINIEFVTDIDVDDAVQKVKDKVDESMGELPSDLEDDPAVFEVNFSEMPIVIYSLAGTCGNACLKNLADDLKDEIESIPGILEVEVTGGLEREIQIIVDPDKLAYYRLPIGMLQNVIYSENQNTSGGSITLGDGRYQLRVPGEFEKPDEIYNLVVSTFNGMPVYLKDVAEVKDTFKDEASRSRLDGNEAVNISVKKRIGENIISITNQIDEIVAGHRNTWPSGTYITKLMDQAKDIRNMVADLENNILSGLLLVIVVLFFVLGFRNALLVSLAIPFSMLLSFMILYFLDITLNMVVLFSLTLALGMLVDNAIVIIENIYRYMEQGVPRTQAAMTATAEVAWPVIGSTLTTLAAFSPMIFWPGIMGEFMKFLPITLIVTLSSSLFVALVINPTLTAIFMKVKNGFQTKIKKSAEEIVKAGENPVKIKGRLLTSYSIFLKHALRHRLAMIGVSFFLLIIFFQIWMIAIGLERPVEFFPSIDPVMAYVNIDPPEGADLDYNDRIAKTLEMAIAGSVDEKFSIFGVSDEQYKAAFASRQHESATGKILSGPSDLANIEHIYSKTVKTPGPEDIFSSNTSNHIGIQFIEMADKKRPAAETLEEIRRRIKDVPGAIITVELSEEGPPTGAPINIEISGENFIDLGEIAQNIKNIIEKIPYVEDVKDDFQSGIPAIRVTIDRQKAALFGLTTNSVGFALKTAYNGLDVSTYYEEDEDYDITVTLAREDRKKTDVLYKLMIPTPSGQLVPLTTIAKIDYTGIIGDIIRINQERVVTVKANVDETKIPGAVARLQAETALKKLPIPPGYRFQFTGEFEEQKESESFLIGAFVIAIFLIFLVLVTLFNSVSQPLIIMTSVILSLGGAFLGLTVINSPFGIIMTGVGVISLAGVVVNNAIVLIDYINKMVNRGIKVSEAVIAAGATRLRPVLLTAVTTILGLIPMVTGVSYDFRNMKISWVSESTQWWQSMAIVVIFGLLIATFLTLVVVPCLYSLLYTSRKMAKDAIGWMKRIYWKPFETDTLQ
ncbi:MAG: efflux RND transporter permease subunit [Desulfobacterales bacterium]|nr:efflux RND transporter permease subunit [Desulfobacterales bacterium]